MSLPIGVCFEEKNEAAIYRRMERKKKTMKEIKKEKEEKWNVSGRKEMVSGGGNGIIWQLTIYLPKRN